MSFKPVSSEVNFQVLEEEILKFWEENKIFEKSIGNRRGKERFVFYEGPPTANGKPHMGHVLQRSIKDLILRFQTMKGKLVERKAGWDTHGLPVEIEVEKDLGLKGKQDILTLKDTEFESIKFFNEKCKESVFKYVNDWINLTKRVGFWIDFDKAFITFNNAYIESVWWFISELNKKGLLYKDYKVVPYCPRCETSLSSHELAQGYKDDIEDPSVYVKFELNDEPRTFLLAWTTTPWTLPGNVALVVDPDADYVRGHVKGETLIYSKKHSLGVPESTKDNTEFKGKDLVGKKYKPLFDFFSENEKAYQVYPADFVSLDEGTGIVHTAVMYGVDDFALGQKLGLPKKHLVNQRGEFIPEVEKFAGIFVKNADEKIIADLDERNLLYKAEKIKHTYPFCWRCDSPILYYALDSWFIKTTAVKTQLLDDNQKINWVPRVIKTGRMKNWLETLIDWNISRNRFWGTPLPIWVCKKGHIKVVGGRSELEEFGGKVPEDLHKPYIDEVALKCLECHEEMKRIPDVADVWMDSGAMPFAQWHYPFENENVYKDWYPADFIVEGVDQTRGWFYTLLAEAMLLGNTPPAPFKNVITTGFILDEFGQKMSKSKGNGMDPWEAIPLSGSDTLRWLMYTAAPAGNNFQLSQESLKERQRKFTLILWNCYKFFVDYANLASWSCSLIRGELTILDKWILARLTEVVLLVNDKLEKYDPTASSRAIEDFVVSDFSTWYIRRSRDRVDLEAPEIDRNTCLGIMYGVLVTLTKLLAPFTPFVAEEMYQNLTEENSVHLTDYPLGDKSLFNNNLSLQMDIVRKLAELGHAQRKEANIKLRQPLSTAKYSWIEKLFEDLEKILTEELNVKNIEYQKSSTKDLKIILDTNITRDLKEEGEARELIRQIQQIRKEMGLTLSDKTKIVASSWPKKYEELILKSTASISIKKRNKLQVIKA